MRDLSAFQRAAPSKAQNERGRARCVQQADMTHLGQGAALADGDEVTELDIAEARRDVRGEVLVALLVTVVLGDVVQVVTADDAGAGQE